VNIEEFVECYIGRSLRTWGKIVLESITEERQYIIALPRKSGVTLFRKAIEEIEKRQKTDNMGLCCTCKQKEVNDDYRQKKGA
jgi:hypothetical protein